MRKSKGYFLYSDPFNVNTYIFLNVLSIFNPQNLKRPHQMATNNMQHRHPNLPQNQKQTNPNRRETAKRESAFAFALCFVIVVMTWSSSSATCRTQLTNQPHITHTDPCPTPQSPCRIDPLRFYGQSLSQTTYHHTVIHKRLCVAQSLTFALACGIASRGATLMLISISFQTRLRFSHQHKSPQVAYVCSVAYT